MEEKPNEELSQLEKMRFSAILWLITTVMVIGICFAVVYIDSNRDVKHCPSHEERAAAGILIPEGAEGC